MQYRPTGRIDVGLAQLDSKDQLLITDQALHEMIEYPFQLADQAPLWDVPVLIASSQLGIIGEVSLRDFVASVDEHSERLSLSDPPVKEVFDELGLDMFNEGMAFSVAVQIAATVAEPDLANPEELFDSMLSAAAVLSIHDTFVFARSQPHGMDRPEATNGELFKAHFEDPVAIPSSGPNRVVSHVHAFAASTLVSERGEWVAVDKEWVEQIRIPKDGLSHLEWPENYYMEDSKPGELEAWAYDFDDIDLDHPIDYDLEDL